MSVITVKRIVYILVLMIVVSAGAKFLINSRNIEQYSFPYKEINLGDSFARVIEILGDPISQEKHEVDHILEELAGKSINVDKLTYKEVSFLVVFEENQSPYIILINIRDPNFRLPKNIGIGTRKSKVLKVFGNPTNSQSDKLFYMNYEDRNGIEFTLINDTVSQIQMSLLND
ncbi:MAG: hypothetical protein HRT90_10050 [Candidatus Margulisbacteria bacterium]|nr:hypothetical protein [Candidatus Margulisiibacteriota bacterium]